MIRPTKPEDTEALIAVANTIGFEPNEIEYLRKILADYFASNINDGPFWITDDDDQEGLVGVAYCELPGKWMNSILTAHSQAFSTREEKCPQLPARAAQLLKPE